MGQSDFWSADLVLPLFGIALFGLAGVFLFLIGRSAGESPDQRLKHLDTASNNPSGKGETVQTGRIGLEAGTDPLVAPLSGPGAVAWSASVMMEYEQRWSDGSRDRRTRLVAQQTRFLPFRLQSAGRTFSVSGESGFVEAPEPTARIRTDSLPDWARDAAETGPGLSDMDVFIGYESIEYRVAAGDEVTVLARRLDGDRLEIAGEEGGIFLGTEEGFRASLAGSSGMFKMMRTGGLVLLGLAVLCLIPLLRALARRWS